jgi:hypothetical protein
MQSGGACLQWLRLWPRSQRSRRTLHKQHSQGKKPKRLKTCFSQKPRRSNRRISAEHLQIRTFSKITCVKRHSQAWAASTRARLKAVALEWLLIIVIMSKNFTLPSARLLSSDGTGLHLPRAAPAYDEEPQDRLAPAPERTHRSTSSVPMIWSPAPNPQQPR